MLIERFDGKIPCDMASLENLPGVGHKTASVVMIQAFNEPAFPVDTHIHRLSIRWNLTSGKNVAQTEKDLKKWFKKESWAKLHLQMIYYGRSYCKARGHDETKCPICLELQKRLS
jgi:endonuclease-3